MRSTHFCFVFTGFLFISCAVKKETQETPETPSYRVERAEEWTALFNRTQGWFGGDGIFAIPFSGVDNGSSAPGDSILFLFSDTMVGEIDDGRLKPGYVMINNSCMILDGEEPENDRTRFLVNSDKDGKPATLFVPNAVTTQAGDYYWLGDGFVNSAHDSSLCIFAYRIRNTNDNSVFPFREVGNDLIIIPRGSKYPFSNHHQLQLPFSGSDSLTTSFGVGVFANTEAARVQDPDGFIYIYGVRGRSKQLVAARVKSDSLENFTAWKFHYGNSTWSSASDAATPIADSVSNELSVTQIYKGQYALIYQLAGLMPTIYMQIGPTPVGPFGPRQKVWSTSDDIKEADLFAYNAKAHPAISKPGELLVSYNVNSFKFLQQIEKIPNLYRPRFVRIVFHQK
ncbi:MAG: DUF4185 domain-containing protein [Cyclobacteriaceae bacterium]